jgi:hypothetical protein
VQEIQNFDLVLSMLRSMRQADRPNYSTVTLSHVVRKSTWSRSKTDVDFPSCCFPAPPSAQPSALRRSHSRPKMVQLDPSHDVWCSALDAVGDRILLKTCNLVCRAWYTYLQPKLMASICIDFAAYQSLDVDVQTMERCKHLVRHLSLHNRDREHQEWQLGIDLAAVSFSNLVTLELRQIRFSTITDLYGCLSMTPPTLKSLIIFDCSCPEIRRTYRPPVSLDDNMVINSIVYWPHSLALRDIEIDSDMINYFACALWGWFAASPTLSVLRVLDIRLMYFDEKDLRSLFDFLSHAECMVEKADIKIGA